MHEWVERDTTQTLPGTIPQPRGRPRMRRFMDCQGEEQNTKDETESAKVQTKQRPTEYGQLGVSASGWRDARWSATSTA